MKKNVLVIGAGVTGLTAALKLQEAGHNVTVWSKEAAGELPTTSANAYAMWVPVRIDADDRVERWTNEGYTVLEQLAQDANTGVTMRRIVTLKPEHGEPWFADSVKVFSHAPAAEIPAGYKDAHVLDSAPIVDPVTYLPWLRKQAETAGVKFEQHAVSSFGDCPAEFDVIINCSGLGARQLASDTTLFPERVQVVKIKAKPGINDVVIDDEGAHKRACVVPHAGYIKLGAVFDGHNETLEVDDAHTADILARCNSIVPALNATTADIISVSRALRPERPLTRVELDRSGERPIVHAYGHDGMGYILSHGVADEIVGYLASL